MLYLAQTDTTAGFLSKNFEEINKAKNRDLKTPCILTMACFSELLNFVRVPKIHKNLVRKARKTSFVYANSRACRVVKECAHSEFLAQNGAFFSSSANLHGQKFDPQKAREITLENGGKIIDERLFEGKPSKLILLLRTKKRKIR